VIEVEDSGSVKAPQTTQNSKLITHNWLGRLFWLVTGLGVTLLALRFGLRLVGVRPDIPFPGFVYSVTAPVVTPFYTLFPVSERFDYYAVEWAALVAAGCVLAAALVIYAAALLVHRRVVSADEKNALRNSRT
jgi:hypothetical protein